MKKILITVICCLTILLYIPFDTFAIEYNDSISDIPNITQTQIDKIQELYNSHSNENLVIFYNYSYNYLYWSYDITTYNSTSKDIILNNIFCLKPDNSIITIKNETTYNIDFDLYFIYLYYNDNLIFKNQYLTNTNISDNYILLSQSVENIERTQYYKPASSNQKRYFSIVDYDLKYVIKGHNFDVYYLIDNVYKIIQHNINSFTIYTHSTKQKFQDSSLENNYPDYPTIPPDQTTTYQNSFKLLDYYFVINDQIDLNTIIVKAPETDSLLTDGNTNSQSVTSNNNQSNQLLDDTIDQMESLENGFKNDLNNNINNINPNDFNISGITQLSNAANFVKVQFDNLTKNNPFGIILGFSLFLGLSLLIIGKRL